MEGGWPEVGSLCIRHSTPSTYILAWLWSRRVELRRRLNSFYLLVCGWSFPATNKDSER